MKNNLYYLENPFPLPGIKHLLKNTFPLYGKIASSGKKIEESGFHQQENIFLLKLVPPNFKNIFQQPKKSSEYKFPFVGMNDSLENMFSLDEKFTFGGSNF